MCTPIDFYPGNETMCGLSQLLITHLNRRPMDTTFLIDEADNLCGSNSSIRKLDLVRKQKLSTSPLFRPEEETIKIDSMLTHLLYRNCSTVYAICSFIMTPLTAFKAITPNNT